jgi:hypothetical protein
MAFRAEPEAVRTAAGRFDSEGEYRSAVGTGQMFAGDDKGEPGSHEPGSYLRVAGADVTRRRTSARRPSARIAQVCSTGQVWR